MTTMNPAPTWLGTRLQECLAVSRDSGFRSALKHKAGRFFAEMVSEARDAYRRVREADAPSATSHCLHDDQTSTEGVAP